MFVAALPETPLLALARKLFVPLDTGYSMEYTYTIQ
jgi:hypothetical protein